MTYEARRFIMLVIGKACALCVLFMSFSDRLTTATGVEYMNPGSFALCSIVAILFLISIRFMGSHAARVAFGCIGLVLVIVWCCLVVYLTWLKPADDVSPEAMLLVYATVGRIATLFCNIQWNFSFSLNRVGEAARSTIVAVLVALMLFLLTTVIDDAVAVCMLIAAILTSSVLNLVMETAMERHPHEAESLPSVEAEDARFAVSAASYPKTRVLYLGARVLYGMALGFLVSVVSVYAPVGPTHAPETLMVVMAIALGVVGVWLFSSSGKGSLYLVAVLPILGAIATSVCFFSPNLVDMAPMFALVAEMVWTIQNLFQLPSYRRMTGMKASRFAYYEYAAQIVPFYFAAWITSSGFDALGVSQESNIPGFVGLMCLLVLMGCSVSAIVWHTVRYHPKKQVIDGVRGERRVEEGPSFATPKNGLLTPREIEVFTLLAEGYSRPYIAKTLYISVDTVKVHARHIYAKLGIDSQDGLIELARGYAPPSDVS